MPTPTEDTDGKTLDTALPSGAADTNASTTDDNPPGADPEPQPSSGAGDDAPKVTEPETMEQAIDAALAAADPEAKAKSETSDDADKDDADETEEADTDDTDGDADPNGEKKDEDGEDADPSDEPTEEELASYRKGPRKRITDLLAERKALRAQTAQLQPDADNYRAIRGFMAENDLADQEVADLFKAGADLKSGDPKRLENFIKVVGPLYQLALEATGKAIPADLQERVQLGEMSEEVAMQLGASRHQTATAQAATQRVQQVQATQQTEQARQAILGAVNQWTAQKQTSDPDFTRKQEVMRRVAQGIVAERGQPRTPQDAVKYAEEAFTEATRLLKAAQPAKAATRPAPSASTSPSRTGVTPTPASLSDVINAALG